MSNVVHGKVSANAIGITVNGVPRQAENGWTIASLLLDLGIEQGRVAVERNRLIVKRPLWGDTPIEAGDQFEIVHFVGGG